MKDWSEAFLQVEVALEQAREALTLGADPKKAVDELVIAAMDLRYRATFGKPRLVKSRKA